MTYGIIALSMMYRSTSLTTCNNPIVICTCDVRSKFMMCLIQGVFFMHLEDAQGVITDELVKEYKWASGRPTSRSGELEDSEDSSAPMMFERALNKMEFEFLQGYRRAWPNAAYQLNQDPYSGHGHHSSSDYEMFTLIANLGLVWSDHVGRWLSPTEALACQHFPVVMPFIHHPDAQLTSFHTGRDDRNGRKVCEQAGNSMHVGVMTLLQLHSLSEILHPRVPDLFRNIKLARTCFKIG